MSKRLYVGNLPYKITESELEDLFGSVGAVESVRVITDRDTGRARGFGFVEMTNDDDARQGDREVQRVRVGWPHVDCQRSASTGRPWRWLRWGWWRRLPAYRAALVACGSSFRKSLASGAAERSSAEKTFHFVPNSVAVHGFIL